MKYVELRAKSVTEGMHDISPYDAETIEQRVADQIAQVIEDCAREVDDSDSVARDTKRRIRALADRDEP